MPQAAKWRPNTLKYLERPRQSRWTSLIGLRTMEREVPPAVGQLEGTLPEEQMPQRQRQRKRRVRLKRVHQWQPAACSVEMIPLMTARANHDVDGMDILYLKADPITQSLNPPQQWMMQANSSHIVMDIETLCDFRRQMPISPNILELMAFCAVQG